MTASSLCVIDVVFPYVADVYYHVSSFYVTPMFSEVAVSVRESERTLNVRSLIEKLSSDQVIPRCLRDFSEKR